MGYDSEKTDTQVVTVTPSQSDADSIIRADNVKLAELGYKSEFRREFSVSRLHNCWFLVVDSQKHQSC